MTNAAARKALEEYAAVGERYIKALEAKDLVFTEPGEGAEYRAQLRQQLAEKGAKMRNAGASIVYGHLSPACEECTGNRGSETFSTTFRCHRDCYFCFNHNQPDYEKFFHEGCPWEEMLERSASENPSMGCVGITGGEPLLDLNNALELLKRMGEIWPDAHKRMYTSGDLLTADSAAALRDAGLDEIRFSVKDDDAPEQQEKVLAAMRLAKEYFPSVMVEMPIIPGAKEHMQNLFSAFQEVGIDGINLLEFCFPFANWEEFEKRGFRLKNLPFDVMYDYGYSGGLAVAGSEELILELMLWAIDEGMTFGMHYCSLDNKHRSEIRQKNERAAHSHPCIALDEEDFFLKTMKVFGDDVEKVRAALTLVGCKDMIEDPEEQSLAFPPAYAKVARNVGAELYVCSFVYECNETECYLIDVDLKPAVR